MIDLPIELEDGRLIPLSEASNEQIEAQTQRILARVKIKQDLLSPQRYAWDYTVTPANVKNGCVRAVVPLAIVKALKIGLNDVIVLSVRKKHSDVDASKLTWVV